ncbi:hypothetical protein SHVI106290_01065 [Shewanella violacea]
MGNPLLNNLVILRLVRAIGQVDYFNTHYANC